MPPARGERVHVFCRIRPSSEREHRAGIACTVSGQTVSLAQTDRSTARIFDFDDVYGPAADQQAVYNDVGAPILDAVLQGYNGTVLAYGQTGTGKTHTLLNVGDEHADAGLVPRLVAALFVSIKCDVRHVYTVKASFAQIYNEQIDDLLKPKNANLRVKPHGTAHEVEGLSATECRSASELLGLFDAGRRALVYAETKMNKHSSRSHAVLQIAVARRERVLDGGSAAAGSRMATLTSGKLTIVDLAGSERVKRSGADEDITGRRMREAININTSLLGLSNVMKALSTQAAYVPYRDSKLTHMLADALGGNCRTSLVVCASPAVADVSESLGTLEFGSRAMKVRTHAVVNQSEVTLDAAALAADLTEALQLQAEGAQGAQLLAMEAELRERQVALAALEKQAEEEAARRHGEVTAALAASESVKAEAARVGEEAGLLRSQLAAAIAARDEAAARLDELANELRDEVTDRNELEAALAVKSRSLQLVESALEDAKALSDENELALRSELERARHEASVASQELAAHQLHFEEVGREAEAAAAKEIGKLSAELQAEREVRAVERGEAARALAEAEAQAEAAMAVAKDAATKDAARMSEKAVADQAACAEVNMACLVGVLADAEAAATDNASALHHRLSQATGLLLEKDTELARAQASLVNAQSSHEIRAAQLQKASLEAVDTTQARDAEVAHLKIQLASAVESHEVAVATLEASVAPLQALVEGLQARLHMEQSEAASKLTSLSEAFAALRGEYETALVELQAGTEAQEVLAARCEAIETLLAQESKRQDEFAASLELELQERERELAEALDESNRHEGKLSLARGEAHAQTVAISELTAKLTEAERAAANTERKLRRTETVRFPPFLLLIARPFG